MRLQILSDLHLEHFDEGRDIPREAVDAVVLAGDIHSAEFGLEWAAAHFSDVPILYVPGNHEYYGGQIAELRSRMRATANRLGIYLLDNDALVLGGMRFLGTTLWSDFCLYDGLPEHDRERMYAKALAFMPDFSIIEEPVGEVFTPEASQALHRQARQWLETELAKPHDGPTLVISHHAPLAECIPTQYQGDPLSPAFASPLEALMGKMDIWIHGHVHEPVNLEIAGTRVIANPGGYPDEFDPPLFQPRLVIDI
ncbi:metallophosphoesterase [Pistricoccus aurantiacus]|uniref:metallophosphoesterase n=1 Tax=Pistricoccus aurantiacus TaxID=1883414 RepID=UPI00363A1203